MRSRKRTLRVRSKGRPQPVLLWNRRLRPAVAIPPTVFYSSRAPHPARPRSVFCSRLRHPFAEVPMWFKQNDPKSPQQPEAAAPRPQSAPAPPAAPTPPAQSAPPAAFVPAAPPAAANASRLTPGLSLKGEVSGREDLWIGGNIDGTVRVDGARVVVGATGKVHGEIEAREIVVEGGMDGNLRAAERLEITPTGNVHGDASAPRISLQEGARYSGSVEVIRPGESASAPRGSASAGRASQAPRGPRFQNAQAAGAAAGTAGPPAASAAESQDGEKSKAASVLLQGIPPDTAQRPE